MINCKKILSLILPILLFGSIFISCNDDVTLNNKVDEGEYVDVTKQALALRSYTSSSEMQNVELRDKPLNLTVYLRQAQSASTDLTGIIAVNEAALTAYNTKNGTAFKMFPADLVTIANSSATIYAGKTQSDSIGVVIKEGASLVVGTSYILPITFTRKSGSDIVNSKDDYLFVVKYMGTIPSTAKANDIVTIMYFEVNNSNILNAGEYTMTNSGKPFADIVTIFAANINFDTETGKVYVSKNENVQAILDNRDKYIKPLQDKGIKVTLSILGNHDGSSFVNLSDAAIADFVKELKTIVDVYGLDGIEFDEEYSEVDKNSLHLKYPGFEVKSLDRYAALCYATKMAMPDKILNIYHISDEFKTSRNGTNLNFKKSINGVEPGTFINYALEAYYGGFQTYIQGCYLGMEKTQVAPYSRKILDGVTLDEYSMKRLRTDGYGVNMLYNYNIKSVEDYKTKFDRIGTILYDEGVTWSGKVYTKDWEK